MLTNLHLEVEKLKQWDPSSKSVDSYGAWWTELMGAVQEFVSTTSASEWTTENISDLLYLLDHSSTDYVAELLTADEGMALALAKNAAAYGSADAKADIAIQLGHLRERRDEGEQLLCRFADDPEERVRRYALLASANLNSRFVSQLAERAWRTGIEHQRIAALSTLKTIGSPLSEKYLAEAGNDGREHLLGFARKCRAG